MIRDYAKTLVELRSELNISQHALASMLGVSYPSVARWETGRFSPAKTAQVKIDRLLRQNGLLGSNLGQMTIDLTFSADAEGAYKALPLSAELVHRFNAYQADDYIEDVKSLGLKKTWEYICQYGLEINENDFIGIDNYATLYEMGLALEDKASKKKSGQYSTPDDVAGVMSEWLDRCDGDAVCDVACGTGKLILTYLDLIGYDRARELISSGKLYIYDLDSTALLICKTALAMRYGLDIVDSINAIEGDFLDRKIALPENCKVIANPPYAQLDRFQDGWEHTEVLLDTKEFFSAFMEKIFRQAKSTVIITPFSFINGTKFYSLRREMCATGAGFVVSFDNIPGNIFCGKKHGVFNSNTSNSVRAAITVMHSDVSGKGFRISPLIRFKNEERDRLLNTKVLEKALPKRYQIVNASNPSFQKVNSDLVDVFDAWVSRSNYTLKDFISDTTTPFLIDMPNTCRYYTTASSKKLNRVGSISVYIKDETSFYFLYCLINSSFTYWWWRIYDGGITYPVGLFQSIPAPINLLKKDDIDFFSETAKELIEQEERFIVTKMNAGAVQENIKFPEEYREKINRRLLSLLGCREVANRFRGVHANQFFEEEM